MWNVDQSILQLLDRCPNTKAGETHVVDTRL